jgi:hypothetical protein
MLEYISDGSPWRGEIINDVRHPLDIESKWTEAELTAIGLRIRAKAERAAPSLANIKTRAI